MKINELDKRIEILDTVGGECFISGRVWANITETINGMAIITMRFYPALKVGNKIKYDIQSRTYEIFTIRDFFKGQRYTEVKVREVTE